MTLSEVSIFLEDAKNLSVKSCTHGRLVLLMEPGVRLIQGRVPANPA